MAGKGKNGNGNGGKNGDGEQRSLVPQGSHDMTRPGDDEETEVQVLNIGAISAMASAEIDRQIATAHAYPRSIAAAKRRIYEMATIDRTTADACYYSLPRSGTTIEGPSVRFAELVASGWGNMRFGAEIIDRQREFVVARGFAHDLETNVAVAITVRRRIVDRSGRRFNDDMQQVTENAACSIALRNAVFRVVPGAITREAYEAAIRLAEDEDGKTKTMDERRREAVGWLVGKGATPEQVFAALGVSGHEDITIENIRYLRGLFNAIGTEGLTLERALQPKAEREAERRGPAVTAPSTLLEGETGAAK